MTHASSRIALLFVAVVGLFGTAAHPADGQPAGGVSTAETATTDSPPTSSARSAQAAHSVRADSLRTVGLREALRLFQENNLSLRRAQSEAQALRGEARQAEAYPNPTLQATHEPLWRGAESQSETYLNVSQQIEWSGRSARIRSARKRAAAARARAAADSGRLALQVTEAYVEAATAETRLRRLRQVTRVFRQADSSMAERRSEGDASGYAARRIRLERARYEQRLAAARLEVRNAREQLALLVLPEGTPSVAAEALPSRKPPAVSVQEALQAALQQRPETVDALVVDEAQDYDPYWWLVISELLGDEAQVTLFADPAQNLFGRDYHLPVEAFEGMVPYPFTLYRNYRNAYEIATWLKERHAEAAEPGEHLPSSQGGVEMRRWKTAEQQQELLHESLDTLEAEGFTPDRLLLLTPFKVENSQALQQISQSHPRYSERMFNVAAVKGLEASVVLLVDIGASEWASSAKVEYVGASRATTRLLIFEKS